MKKEMLKIAGVRSESSFYKLYPTEEAFMKVHGKEFKKALLGERIKKAQMGTTQGGYNQMAAGANNQAATEADVQGAISTLSTGTPKKTTGQSIAEGVSDIPILGSLVSGIVGLFDAGAERKRQVRAGHLSDLQLAASQSAPRQQNRKYVRPEDQVSDISSLTPAEGTGTNFLGKDGITISKNGKEVPRADWGSILSSVLSSSGKSGGGSGGGIGGLVGNILGSVLGGGGQQTTVETTTQDPARMVIANNLLSSRLASMNKYQTGGWVDKVLNDKEGGVSGLIGKALGGQGENNSLVKNPTLAANIEQGTQATATGFSAIPGMNTKMAQSSKQIGETVGSLIPIPGAGPVLGLVGQAVGAIAEDKSGKKAMARIQRNTNQMASAQAAKVLQSNQNSFVRTGGNIRRNSSDMEESGELNTLWGGHATPISYNPYLPEQGETVMFHGRSHDESDGRGRTGIGVHYGENGDLTPYDANVEVERGEPAVQLRDETGDTNLVVFGNLPIPKQFVKQLGDPDAKGKKFKGYVASLSKKENTQNQIIKKATDDLSSLDIKNTFDKMKYDTLSLLIKGADSKLKDIATKKNNAAFLQQAINDTADEMNLDPEKMVKGKMIAKKGIKIKKKDEDYIGIGDKYDITHRFFNPTTAQENVYGEAPTIEPVGDLLSKKRIPKTKVEEKEPFEMPQFFNPLSPYLPSSQEELDPRQLTGEYFALATNQLEPVPAQLYHPELKTPYEISMQDAINENIATARALQRLTTNPAAQANIAAQLYQANQKVYADQFRVNQELKDKVYGENINVLNDAKLKNLGILDTQYQRQAEALSKTKDVAREALSSISDKYLQNQLQNRTLATYENLYNYRYDPRFHAWNMNPPAQWNMEGSSNLTGLTDLTPEEREELEYKRAKERAAEEKRKRRKAGGAKNGAILKAMKNL